MKAQKRHESTYEDPGLAVGGGPGKATEEKQQDELRRGSKQEAFENLLKDKSTSLWCWLWFRELNRGVADPQHQRQACVGCRTWHEDNKQVSSSPSSWNCLRRAPNDEFLIRNQKTWEMDEKKKMKLIASIIPRVLFVQFQRGLSRTVCKYLHLRELFPPDCGGGGGEETQNLFLGWNLLSGKISFEGSYLNINLGEWVLIFPDRYVCVSSQALSLQCQLKFLTHQTQNKGVFFLWPESTQVPH